jgi:hypothetical protein
MSEPARVFLDMLQAEALKLNARWDTPEMPAAPTPTPTTNPATKRAPAKPARTSVRHQVS